MVIKYNKFNTNESIYTERDINNILDKGAINFTDSDRVVLTSYATNDKELLKILDIIKGYTKRFKELNKEIEERVAKNPGKPEDLMDRWVKMSRELSKYENELKNKFQIEDPMKLGKLLESIYYRSNDELPIDNMPLYKIGDVVKFRENPDSIQSRVSEGIWSFDDEQRRFIEENKDKTLRIIEKYCTGPDNGDERFNNKWWSAFYCEYAHNGSNTMWYLDETIRSVETVPSYKPRRIDRTIESNEWYPYRVKTEKELSEEFGNDWRRTACHNIGWNGGMDLLLGKDYPEKNFKIEDYGEDDWLIMKVNPNGISWTIIPKLLIKNSPKPPSYKPRKIERTFEANNDILTAKEICIMVDNMEEFDIIKKLCSSLGYHIIFTPRGFPHYVFINLKEKSSSFVNYSDRDFLDAEESSPKYILDNVYKRRYTINDLEVITKILESGKIIDVPSYKPRKIERTLENLNESFEFVSTEERLKNWPSKPNFQFGQMVTLKKNAVEIHLSKINGRYNETVDMIDWLKEYIGRMLIVTGFVNDPNWNNLWIVDCRDEFGSNHYVQQDALTSYYPSYAPRKIDRTTESVENKYYNQVIFKTNNSEEYLYVLNYLFNNTSIAWFGSDRNLRQVTNDYPVYLFVNFRRNDVTWGNEENLGDIEEYIEKENRRNSNMSQINPHIFNYKDVDKIERIKRGINIDVPNYKPRKIDRTLESSTTRYDVIIFKTNSYEEVNRMQWELLSKGYKWCNGGTRVLDFSSNRDLPIYFYIDGNERWFFIEPESTIETDLFINIKRKINGEMYQNVNICRNIFNISQVYNIESLFKMKPSYAPRKIDRTLEAFDYYPYRFKTEKEMVKDYGENWRRIVYHRLGLTFVTSMDYLLGQEVKMDIPVEWEWTTYHIQNSTNERRVGWSIAPEFITLNKPIIPSYAPRKFDRTLEGKYETLIHYPYRFKTEQEMMDAFGDNWRSTQFEGVGWSDQEEDEHGNFIGSAMDRYLGKPFPYTEEELIPRDESAEPIKRRYEGWAIHWDMLTSNKPKVPSYKPRKIDRTIEGYSNDCLYNRCVFKIINEEESMTVQNYLFENGYTWRSSYNDGYDKFKSYPQIIWVYFIGKKIANSIYDSGSPYTEERVHKYIKSENKDNGEFYVNPKIFEAKDIQQLDLIKKTGVCGPNYRPRKIDRTLESINEGYKGYPYDSIIIQVDNIKDLDRLKPYLSRYHPYDAACDGISSKFKRSPNNPNYVRINLMDDVEDWYLSHGTIYYLLGNSGDSYDKIYKVEDVERGIIDNFIKSGKILMNPSYKPRKIDRNI
jgi:hypothetical protein